MSQHIPVTSAPHIEPLRLAIVSTEWNGHICQMMLDAALQRVAQLGYDVEKNVSLFTVPGAVELTFAASQLIESSAFDAVIVYGCVIRGGTPHFDYVCQSVTQGVTQLNADVDTPVIFGVLTVDREEDAVVRAEGPQGKGAECVDTAIKMVAFKRAVDDL